MLEQIRNPKSHYGRSRALQRILSAAVLALVASLAIASCGGSDGDDPQTTACDAMFDIIAQSNQLQAYSRSEVTAELVQDRLDTIRSDLQTIEDSLRDLDPTLRRELEQGVMTYRSELSGFLTNAERQADAARRNPGGPQAEFTRFADAYGEGFALVPCGPPG